MSGSGAASRRGEYSARVRELFMRAEFAGDLPNVGGRVVTASVSDGAAGPVIQLSGSTDDDRWLVLRYRVFGCPHLIAAAEWAAERIEGAPVEAARFPIDALIETLGVPVEKTGRILLLEDAFTALDEKRREGLETGA